jgi:hypothetical protein
MAIWSVVFAGQGGDAQPGASPNASSIAKPITAGHFSTASTQLRHWPPIFRNAQQRSHATMW